MSYASEADDIAELEAEDARLALAEVDQVKAEADRLFARGDAESGGGAKGPPAGHRAYGRAAELYLRALDGVHRGGAGDTELCCSIHLNLAMTAFRVRTYAPMFRHAAEAVRVACALKSLEAAECWPLWTRHLFVASHGTLPIFTLMSLED